MSEPIKKDIRIILVVGASPLVSVNQKLIKMEGDRLLYLQKEILDVTGSIGFPRVHEISAWGGELRYPHVAQTPTKTLEEFAHFERIVLHGIDGFNTSDHRHTDQIRPLLSLLVWHESEHFTRVKGTGSFECLVCKKRHFVNQAPDFCENAGCFSHEIERTLYGTRKSVSIGKQIHRDTM